MPLVRTEKGLQYLSDELAAALKSAPAPETPSKPKLPIGSKELLPWVIAACHLISWFGVRYLASDRMQQQQQDDHVAIADIRMSVGKLENNQSALTAKLELFIGLTAQRKDK